MNYEEQAEEYVNKCSIQKDNLLIRRKDAINYLADFAKQTQPEIKVGELREQMSNSELLKKIGIAKMTAKIKYDNLHAELIQEIYDTCLNNEKQLQQANEQIKALKEGFDDYWNGSKDYKKLHILLNQDEEIKRLKKQIKQLKTNR